MDLPFFGLTSTYRAELFKKIHEIVFHGKGGYTWYDVYSMPIWLRKFTFNEIKEFYENENKRYQEQQPTKKTEIARPDISPSYKSKASKK